MPPQIAPEWLKAILNVTRAEYKRRRSLPEATGEAEQREPADKRR
jgi:hypothetical protein